MLTNHEHLGLDLWCSGVNWLNPADRNKEVSGHYKPKATSFYPLLL